MGGLLKESSNSRGLDDLNDSEQKKFLRRISVQRQSVTVSRGESSCWLLLNRSTIEVQSLNLREAPVANMALPRLTLHDPSRRIEETWEDLDIQILDLKESDFKRFLELP